MSRLNVRALDPEGGADGQVPVISGGKFVIGDQSAGGSLTIQDENGNIATGVTQIDFQGAGVTATEGSGEVVVTIPGGSGSSGSSGTLLLEYGASVPAATPVGTIIFMKSQGSTTWDFTKMSALPADWGRRGITGETFGANGITLSAASGQAIYTNIPNNYLGDFLLEAKLTAFDATSKMPGIQAATTDGNSGASASFYNNPAGLLVATMKTAGAYGGTFASAGGSLTPPKLAQLKKAGTAYTCRYSDDGGTSWSPWSSSVAVSTALSVVGLGSIYGTAGTMTVSYLTFTPQGSGAGGLQGWWNGSKIVPF